MDFTEARDYKGIMTAIDFEKAFDSVIETPLVGSFYPLVINLQRPCQTVGGWLMLSKGNARFTTQTLLYSPQKHQQQLKTC